MTEKDLLIFLQLLFDNKNETLSIRDINEKLNGILPDTIVNQTAQYISDHNLIVTRFKLNDRGIEYFNDLTTRIVQEKKLKIIADQKLIDDAKISSWTAKKLLFTFIFSIIGGGYAIIDIVLKVIEKPEKELYNTLQAKMDTLSSEIHASKNFLDSLKNTTSNHVTTLDSMFRRQD